MEGVESDAPDKEMNDAEPGREVNMPHLPSSLSPSRTGFELEPYCPPNREFNKNRIVFQPRPDRMRRPREPIFF